MKEYSRFGWSWLAALMLLAPASLSGCRTSSARRAESPMSDSPGAGKGESIGAFAPAAEVRPCRFG